MGLLSGLFDRARALLGRPAPAGTAKDAVEHGALDRLVFNDLLEEVPSLRELVDDLNIRYAGTEDLVRDQFMGFFQSGPRLRGEQEMAPSRIRNWSVARDTQNLPATAETREYTVGNKYGATMATLSVASQLRQMLDANEEVQDKAEQAEQAQQELEQANAALAEAMAAAAADEGGDEEALAAALQQAIAEAEQAGDGAQAACQAANAAAAAAGRRMQGKLSEAVAQAGKELAEEAELLQAWGQEPGQVEMMSIAERQRLVQMLKNHEVSRYIQLLGRFMFSERASRAKRTVPGRDEVYDIERSSRLGDVLSSELFLLANEMTEMDFMQRMAEGQLLTRAYRGTEKAGKGAIILCVDTSSSMRSGGQGYSPGAWSKAFALALLQRCKADGRDFVGILFSSRSQVQTFRFPKGRAPIEQVLEFVGKAFNGGTNFEAPLDEAVDILEAEFNAVGRRRGDIVFVTDDECQVSPEWLAFYRKRKVDLGFRTWGIACGKKRAGRTLDELSDNVRAISEFVDPTPVADLMKAI